MVCAGLFASCSGNCDTENNTKREVEALRHENAELKHQLERLQMERDSLGTIVERVREYVASIMNY